MICVCVGAMATDTQTYRHTDIQTRLHTYDVCVGADGSAQEINTQRYTHTDTDIHSHLHMYGVCVGADSSSTQATHTHTYSTRLHTYTRFVQAHGSRILLPQKDVSLSLSLSHTLPPSLPPFLPPSLPPPPPSFLSLSGWKCSKISKKTHPDYVAQSSCSSDVPQQGTWLKEYKPRLENRREKSSCSSL